MRPPCTPLDFQTRDEVLVKAGAVMRRYHDSGLEFKTSFDPVAKIDEYKAILDEHQLREALRGLGAHGGGAGAHPRRLRQAAAPPGALPQRRAGGELSCSRASRCG